ncbi:MAG: threonylcarbamoyl-AMP synthase [Lachnospiraceae bacterium]|nr:threonylcarbamoyl-AMP synthase [Lachnospiraceae bacterium]
MSIQTKYIQIATSAAVQDQELLEAAQIIRDGGLVAFPTETVYGLGANALDEKAAKKIYEAKGRPSDNPLIAHISCYEELEPLVTGIPQAGGKLARRYWPGPLTMVFPKSPAVPYGTTGGLDTVAVRMPSDPVASRLIALAGVPVAAPSANLSGRPSPTTARHVWQDMNGRINMILDGGPVGIGLESTIVDVSGPVPVLLRPGAITLEMLRDTVGKVEVDPAIQGPPAEGLRPKAPGMKYRHYAPRGELTLVEGESRAVVSAIRRLVEEGLAEGRKVAVICTEETRDQYSGGILRCVGTRTRQETIAHNLFAVLRELDDLGAEIIYSESFSQDHLGRAVMNRLMKAAGYRVIQV